MTPDVETWRPVVGYEGCYEVSDQGQVRSVDRYVVRRGSRPANAVFHRGRILATFPRPDGRPTVRLSMDGAGETVYVPALMLEAFVGPRPEGYEACHNDGNAANNILSNLRWDTYSGNSYDAVHHGTHQQTSKTHCNRGHLLQAPNLVACLVRKGHRGCLACSRAQAVGRKAALRGSAFDMQEESDLKYAVIMRGRSAA